MDGTRMTGIGIIAEYNPFHNGHRYHIAETRRLTGADNIIAVMSGSFVQRGEPACMDKFTRAELALRGGADLVIELPDILSCACAEKFAYGGVKLLSSTGLVSGISFGSESGDIQRIRSIAETEVQKERLREELAKGIPYPEAFSNALGSDDTAALIDAPNDTLAVEYLRAISKIDPDLDALSINRIGSQHNSNEAEGIFASAGYIRTLSSRGCITDAAKYVPDDVNCRIRELSESGLFPASLSALSGAILYRLRMLGRDGIAELPDVSEGLENPIYKAALESSDIDELLLRVKTKRYTMARLKRILIAALLDSDKSLLNKASSDQDALYIRVLGVRKDKLNLLSELNNCALLPVVIDIHDAEELSDNAKQILEHSRRASLIHALACPNKRDCIDDFSHPLIIV